MKPTHRAPTLSRLLRRAMLGVVCATVVLGCPRDEPPAYRGPGLQVVALPVDDVVGVYRTALASAFSLDDPALVLLLDPRLLPRGAGLAGGDSLPAAVRSALHRQRFVKGTCQVPVTEARLICQANRPGYVVRLSPPLALGQGRDSVQVHLVAQQYAVPGRVAERIRFERAYHLTRRGQVWRAVSEARLPRP